ncbi:MAG: 4Fe-4S dicluster domain-containing protein [Eubacteriaceae bacterium]|nr:4Fe-4S dicluster domain-containing protein [Eubacteriaceae bacterium]
MIYNQLGNTGILVSKLCFGSLTLGPLQANLSVERGGELIAYAMEKGVNFLDTAALYNNYGQIREGLKRSSRELIIATKSYDFERSGIKANFENARRSLDRDVIDIFMLHEQENEMTIKGHMEALDYLLEQKVKGNLKAVGISTHRVEGVLGACKFDFLDVIHPIMNFRGLGIEDGSAADMEKAITYAHSKGKGIFAMKPLGGGNLIKEREEAFKYLSQQKNIHSIAIGMQSEAEIEYNIAMVLGEEVPADISETTARRTKTLHIDEWCIGCEACISVCGQKALFMEQGKAQVNKEKCILCGYCGAKCPQFCIKVI